jgi:hypothetical protein
MILRLPRGSSVYRIFPVIDSSPFPPVARSIDADHATAIGKADGQNSVSDFTEAVISALLGTVGQILGDYASGISEGELCQDERYAVLPVVLLVLV